MLKAFHKNGVGFPINRAFRASNNTAAARRSSAVFPA
jgi:hypothetical protein